MEDWKKKLSVLIREGLYQRVTDEKEERVFGYVKCSDEVMEELDALISREVKRAKEDGYKRGVNEGLRIYFTNTTEEWEEDLCYVLDCVIQGETEGKRGKIQEMTKSNKEYIKHFIKQLLKEKEVWAREKGYKEGREEGYKEGFEDGLNRAKEEGFEQGYEEAIFDAVIIEALKSDEEFIEMVSKIAERFREKKKEEEILNKVFGEDDRCEEDKRADLDLLYSLGEISEKEYKNSLSKLNNKSNGE